MANQRMSQFVKPRYLSDEETREALDTINDTRDPSIIDSMLIGERELLRRKSDNRGARRILSRENFDAEEAKYQKNYQRLIKSGVPEEEARKLADEAYQLNFTRDPDDKSSKNYYVENAQFYGGEDNAPWVESRIQKRIADADSAQRKAKEEARRAKWAEAIKADKTTQEALAQERADKLAAQKADIQKSIEENREKLKKNSYVAKRNDAESEHNRTLRARAEELAKEAGELGYKNVSVDDIIQKAKDRVEKRRANAESRLVMRGSQEKIAKGRGEIAMMDDFDGLAELRTDLYSNANKKVMNQRGEQMLAEQKAREEAIRNNPQAAQRREALAREWGKPQVSFAQAEAKARWAAKDNADRYGRRNNIGAAMDAYVGSSRHGFDTVANLGGNGRPVNLSLPKGSAADNYMRAYEFNQGVMKAQQDIQQAKVQQERNLAQQATTLANVTPPNASPEVKANNVAAMGKAGASPTQPQPIKG